MESDGHNGYGYQYFKKTFKSQKNRQVGVIIALMNEWMNENARILSAFENRLRAGFV